MKFNYYKNAKSKLNIAKTCYPYFQGNKFSAKNYMATDKRYAIVRMFIVEPYLG